MLYSVQFQNKSKVHQIKHQLYAVLLGQFALFLSIDQLGQVVLPSLIWKMEVVKLKSKLLAYKLEVQ